MKKIIVSLCKLSVAFGILYYLLQRIEFEKIFQVMKSADFFYIILAFILVLVSRYLMACQTKIVLLHQGISFSIFRVFKINLESFFYDLFVPGGSTTVKWYKFSKPEKKRAQAFTSLVVVRLLNILTMTAIGTIALFLKNPFSSFRINVAIIGILILLAFSQLAIFNKTISSFIGKHINNLLSFFPGFIREKIIKIQNSFKNFQELSNYNRFLLLFISVWLHFFATIVFFLVSISIRINLSITVMTWITSVVLLIQIIPISFSGLGVREGALLFLFERYHIPGSDALAFSFIIFGIATAVALLGGVMEAKNYFKQKLS